MLSVLRIADSECGRPSEEEFQKWNFTLRCLWRSEAVEYCVRDRSQGYEHQ